MTAPWTAADLAPIPHDQIEPGRDYAYREEIQPEGLFASPKVTPRRVTVIGVTDRDIVVRARERIYVVGYDVTASNGEAINRYGVQSGDVIRVRYLGKPWDEVGPKVDAAREREQQRIAAHARIHRDLAAGGDLGDISVSVDGVLDLLDERDDLLAEVEVLRTVDRHGALAGGGA